MKPVTPARSRNSIHQSTTAAILFCSFFLFLSTPLFAAFTDLGNGTVFDDETGLTWQKSDDGIPRTWEEALGYSENLNFANCTNWRLPNRTELRSLVDRSHRDPAIAPLFNSHSDNYWTSTPISSSFNRIWSVDFFKGKTEQSHPLNDVHFIRAVTGGCEFDGTPPEVTSMSPADSSVGIPVSSTITAGFNEEINQVTLTATSFRVEDASGPLPGTITYSNGLAEFVPSANLSYGTTYTTILTTAIQDPSGNPLLTEHQWSFTTEIDADIQPPIGSISINSGAAWTRTVSVALMLSASDNSGTVASMQFRESGGQWTGWEAYQPSKSWTLSAGEGAKTVESQFQDASGNISITYSDTITVDTLSPTVSISPATTPTGQDQQILSGLTEIGSTVTVSSDTWTTVSAMSVTGTSWQCLVSGLAPGANNLTVVSTDAAGNISAPEMTTIVYDNEAPVGTIAINNGAPYTNTSAVNLTLTASDNLAGDLSYRIANGGTTFSQWQLLTGGQIELPWHLTQGDGFKTVLVQFQDALSNSSASITGSITLDTEAPSVSVTPEYTETNQTSILLSGTMESFSTLFIVGDTQAVVGTVQYLSATSWQANVTNLAIGPNSFTVTAVDSANNSAQAISETVYDYEAPLGSLKINYDAPVTNATNVLLSITANDDRQIFEMRLRNGGDTSWGAWTPFTTSAPWSLPAGDGDKTVEAQLADIAGNISGIIGDTISLDTSSPAITIESLISPVNSSAIDINGTRENGVTVSVSAPGALVGPVDLSISDQWQSSLILQEGLNSIIATATDGAGNSSSVSASVVLDSIAEFTISPPVTPTSSNSQLLSGTVESGSIITVNGAPATVSDTSWSYQADNLSQGDNIITVTSTDSLSNTGSNSVVIYVDNNGPTGSVTINNDADLTSSRNVALFLSLVEDSSAASSVLIRKKGDLSWSEPKSFVSRVGWTLPSGDGSKTVEVQFVDASGNTSPIYEDSITLDTTAPVITIAPVETPTASTSQAISGSRETGSVVAIYAPGGLAEQVTYPDESTWQGTVSFVSGQNTITAIATDSAGNRGSDATTVFYDDSTYITIDAVTSPTPVDSSIILSGTRETEAAVTISAPTATAANVEYPDPTSWQVVLNNLADGNNPITASATDLLGNTAQKDTAIFVDKGLPFGSITINNNADITNSTTVTLSLTATDSETSVSLMRIRNSGQYWSSWTDVESSLTWSLLPTDGTKSVDVEFQDAAGNVSSVYSDTIILDRTSPSVTIDPVISPTIETAQTLSGSMELDATVTLLAPGITVGPITHPTTTTWQSELTNIPEGTNTITLLASDIAGNKGSAATTIVVDHTANITIDTINSPTNKTSMAISGTRDANASVALEINTIPSAAPILFPTATTWSSVIGGLQEGPLQITATSTDTLGNTGSASRTVTVDHTAPPLSFTVPALDNERTILLSGQTEAGAQIEINAPGVSAGSINRFGTDWSSSLVLAEGDNIITVTARDAAGNESTVTRQTTLDTIANVTVNPISYTSEPVQLLTGTIENGGTIQLSVNTSALLGTAQINGTSWQCQVTLVEGSNLFTVDATDGLGNSGQAQTSITLDSTPPVVTIDPAPPSLVSAASLTINGTKSADGLVVITSPTAAVLALGYPTDLQWQASLSLAEGLNAISVTTQDPAGNSSPPANVQITRDSIAELTFTPLASITNAVSHSISGTLEVPHNTFSVSSTEASINPEISINGTGWSGSISLTEGVNTISVELNDILSNNSIESQTIILDSKIPQVTIDPVSSFLAVSTVTLEGNRDSDAAISIRNVNTQQDTSFTVTGNLPSSTRWSKQVTLSDGENSITVTAKDAAGNASSASVTINVDTTAQVTIAPIASPSSQQDHHLTGTMESGSTVDISINGNVPVEASYDTPVTWSLDTILAEGANQITVTGTDQSQNTNTVTANVVVDTTPPDQVTNLTATDTLLGGSVHLDWSGYPANGQGVALFRLYVSPTDFSNVTDMVPLRDLSPGSSKFTVEGVTNGVIWYFAVVGVDVSGNLNPEVITKSSIPTTQGIDGYVLDTDTGHPLWGAQVRISSELSTTTNRDGYFHLAGLAAGTYDLQAFGAGYESTSTSGLLVEAGQMTAVNFNLTKIVIPPSIPENVVVTAGDSKVTISWNGVSDTSLDGYQLFRFTSPSDTAPIQVNPELITGTFYVDMGLVNNQTFYYTVRSVNRDGLSSADSTMVSATPVATPPLPPSNLLAVLTTPGNKAQLTWDSSPTEGVDTYNIYTDNGTGVINYSSVIDTVHATTTTWTSSQTIAPGNTHYFGLRAEKNSLEENNTTLIASVSVPVVIYSGPKVIIAAPYSGKTISGTMVTMEGALFSGDITQVKNVLFQFRPLGSTQWLDIAPASAYSLNPDSDNPFFIHWDVVTDVAVGEYELRAVTTAIDDSVDTAPETIVVTVDHANATTIEDTNSGNSDHMVKNPVRRWLNNTLSFYAKDSSGAYTIVIPPLSSESDTEIIVEIPKAEEMAPKLQGYASIGKYLRLKLSSGQTQFPPGTEVEITFPYPDANNDEIVDGTSIHADDLEIRWYNPGSDQWENSGIIQVSVDKVAKTVTATTSHFSVFAVIGTDASGGISTSTNSLPFGQVTLGSTSPSQLITIAQNGGTDVAIGSLSLTGPNVNDFTIALDNCSSTNLTVSGTCQVALTFSPTAVGSRNALLSIPSSDPGSPLEIQLNGEGTVPIADADGDGMPDSWEAAHGVDDPDGDPDGDGYTNLEEYLNGTDPNVDESTVQPTKVPVHNGFWLLSSMITGLYLLRRRRVKAVRFDT